MELRAVRNRRRRKETVLFAGSDESIDIIGEGNSAFDGLEDSLS